MGLFFLSNNIRHQELKVGCLKKKPPIEGKNCMFEFKENVNKFQTSYVQ